MNLGNNVKFSRIETPRIIVKATKKLMWIWRKKARVAFNKPIPGLNYLLTSKSLVIFRDLSIRLGVIKAGIKVFERFLFYSFGRDDSWSKVFVSS